MKPILTFMLTALLTTPLMAAAEGLKFKRHDEPNGMDDYTGQITSAVNTITHLTTKPWGLWFVSLLTKPQPS